MMRGFEVIKRQLGNSDMAGWAFSRFQRAHKRHATHQQHGKKQKQPADSGHSRRWCLSLMV
ncbi:MAG: hypothetical protein B7Z81_01135 [Acidocella sp. 20-61-6]|nr:MAG: hypothetical protein B7Z81_01135 [Acidocella sp. 20-61-6]